MLKPVSAWGSSASAEKSSIGKVPTREGSVGLWNGTYSRWSTRKTAENEGSAARLSLLVGGRIPSCRKAEEFSSSKVFVSKDQAGTKPRMQKTN